MNLFSNEPQSDSHRDGKRFHRIRVTAENKWLINTPDKRPTIFILLYYFTRPPIVRGFWANSRRTWIGHYVWPSAQLRASRRSLWIERHWKWATHGPCEHKEIHVKWKNSRIWRFFDTSFVFIHVMISRELVFSVSQREFLLFSPMSRQCFACHSNAHGAMKVILSICWVIHFAALLQCISDLFCINLSYTGDLILHNWIWFNLQGNKTKYILLYITIYIGLLECQRYFSHPSRTKAPLDAVYTVPEKLKLPNSNIQHDLKGIRTYLMMSNTNTFLRDCVAMWQPTLLKA